MITITERAANEIRRIIESQGMDDCVRLAVKGGGCAGYVYKFDFDSEKTKRDLEFESHGIYILCDKKSYLFVKGTEIDWGYGLMDNGVIFNNPMAKSSCGCNESFLPKDPNTEVESIFKPTW